MLTADHEHATRFDRAFTGGLCDIVLAHPAGTFAPTPATRVAAQAVCRHTDLLNGTGIDWGSGIGCLALLAAHVPDVERCIGLEIDAANVDTATRNAHACRRADSTRFLRSDSWVPCDAADREYLASLEGDVDFILANPPSSSPHDDGFGFRRAVVRGAARFLRPGGRLFLSVSAQYGMRRVEGLLEETPGFTYGGILASSDWVPFDMGRPDLLGDVTTYAAEERRGGLPYDFRHPDNPDRGMTAVEALAGHASTGRSPLSRWQSHLLRFEGRPR